MTPRGIIVTIEYLLKFTDDKHPAVLEDIVDYLAKYNVKSNRHGVGDLLDCLYDARDVTKNIGFTLGKKAFRDSRYQRYYVKDRLLDINDINNIKVALYKDNNNLSTKDKEIIDGLTKIFVSQHELDSFNDPYKIDINTLTGKRRDALKVISEAYKHQQKVEITKYDIHNSDGKKVEGIVTFIKPSYDDYIIHVYDDEFYDLIPVSLKTIKSARIIDERQTAFKEVIKPGLDSFMTSDKRMGFMTMPNGKQDKLEYISFMVKSIDTYESLLSHFKSIENRSEIEKMIYNHKDNEFIKVELAAGMKDFISWATRSDVILNIKDVMPNKVNKGINNYFKAMTLLTSIRVDIKDDGDTPLSFLALPKGRKEIDLPLDAKRLAKGGNGVKKYIEQLLIEQGIVRDWFETNLVFSNLNKDGKSFSANPKCAYGKIMNIFFFNDPISRRCYIFEFDYNELFNLETPFKNSKRDGKIFDIQLHINDGGIFVHKSTHRPFSNRLPLIINY